MFGINQVLNNAVLKKQLTEEEKIRILRSKKVNPKVIKFLIDKFRGLYIEVLNRYEGSLFELMKSNKLQGWCWETTESAIIFLDDNDYIERGNLIVDDRTPEYYHSWICFAFNETEYVLDPCLNFLCKKDDYYKIFNPVVKAKVMSKKVKEELIRQITSKKEKKNSENQQSYEDFLRIFLGDDYDSYQESKKEEIFIDSPEDVNTPLYRNDAGYVAEIKDGKIKKLTAHYYWNDC